MRRSTGSQRKLKKFPRLLGNKRSLKPNEIISFLTELRERVVKVVNKTIVRFNSNYDTKVIETPPYLSGIFPSGGAFFYDMLTDHPREIFLTTTDPKRDPNTTAAELLNLLVHGEYGHFVHSSNSAAYGAKPTIIDMLPTPLGANFRGNLVPERTRFFRFETLPRPSPSSTLGCGE